MNGRVYDPRIGRFVSPDPFVQAPYFSQSYNRYAYVFNSPMSSTDPSGFFGAAAGDVIVCSDVCLDISIGIGGDAIIDAINADIAAGLGSINEMIESVRKALAGIQIPLPNPQTPADPDPMDHEPCFEGNSDVPSMCKVDTSESARDNGALDAIGDDVVDVIEEVLRRSEGAPGGGAVTAGKAIGGKIIISVLGVPARGIARPIAKIEKQLAEHGRAAVERSLRSLEKQVATQRQNLETYRAQGGYTSSIEREIRAFEGEIQAIKDVLGRGP
jgi:hypothetical protein